MQKSRSFTVTCVTALLFASIASAQSEAGWQSRVSAELLRLYHDRIDKHVVSPGGNPSSSQQSIHVDAQGRVQIDAQFDCSAKAPIDALRAAGLEIGTAVKSPPLCVVEGWADPSALPQIANVDTIEHIKLPDYALRKPRTGRPEAKQQPRPSAPPNNGAPQGAAGPGFTQGAGGPMIDGNGILISRADQYIAQTGVSGAGITVGVISDDATSLATIQSRGELPSVSVIPGPANPSPTDEGTMMLEEVHAVAPGASLAFCGAITAVEYLSCLQQLGAGGATILVDDEAFPSYDAMSSSGLFTQSVQTFLSSNPSLVLFTVTENYNGSYWEGSYTPVTFASLGYSSFTCPSTGQTDNYAGAAFQVTVYASNNYDTWMQWADPWGQNASNFELYAVDAVTNQFVCYSAAGSANTYFDSQPALIAGHTYYILIGTPDASLSGKFIKFFVGGDNNTAITPSTNGSIVSPQAFAPGVVLVGAVNASDNIGNTIESYSGRGPINFVFPSPSSLQAPSLVSTDAVYVDASGTMFPPWSDGLFHGTSAAAPNAAALAALILSAFPSLTPAQLTGYLQAGAIQLGNTLPDSTFGYGRADALGALAAIPLPTVGNLANVTITGGTSSSGASVTVGGVGNLRLSIQSSNGALVPASLVSAGAPGVTVSPASCGTSTTLCTISVTPAIGQTGTANLTLSVTDGANRVASTTTTITATSPPPPVVSITGNASQTINVGAAAGAVTFTLNGTGPITVSVSSSNTALLPNSSVTLSGAGCGPSVNANACIANLAPVSGQSGAATITISVKDPYGQTATANASLQVNASSPPANGSGQSGGGGAMDIWLLIGLGAMLASRARGVSRTERASGYRRPTA